MTVRAALPWWSLAIALIVVDQLTKVAAEQQLGLHQPVAILPFFNLTLMYNEGAAFSFLSDAGGWHDASSMIGLGSCCNCAQA